jgi:hypothetical protein
MRGNGWRFHALGVEKAIAMHYSSSLPVESKNLSCCKIRRWRQAVAHLACVCARRFFFSQLAYSAVSGRGPAAVFGSM